MEFSGKTSCYEHKRGDDWKESPGAGQESVQMKKIIEAQWSNMPIEIYEIVQQLWRLWELGNDYFYQPITPNDVREQGEDGIILGEEWRWGETQEEKLGWVMVSVDVKPLADWMESKGIESDEKVLLHYWW